MRIDKNIAPARRDKNSRQANCLARIRSKLPSLAASEAQVGKWVLKNADKAVYLSMARVGEECGVSDTTVLRFCRSVGFHGFTDLKISLARDLTSSTQLIHEAVTEGDSPMTVARKVFSSNIRALHDTLDVLDESVLNQSVDLLAAARHILIIGVGTSGPIVQSLYNRLFRLGLSCTAETDSYLQLMKAALLEPGDVVVAISQSGSSVDPVLTLQEAKSRGAKTICITGNAKSPITEYADLTLISVSTERPLEAIAARIAQASIVDALCVSLSLRDVEKTLRNDRLIWNAVIPKSV